MNAFAVRVPLFTALALIAGLAPAARASAQECETDADCRLGNVCVTGTSELCGLPMPPEACEPGQDCGPVPEPSCAPYSYSYCTAAPCAANSDCPADMVCYAQLELYCTVYPSAGSGGGEAGRSGSCGDDEMCAPSVTECHEEPGDPVCVPRHVPPCSADADCGPGFSCKESIAYECSGGMAAGAGGAGGAAGAAGDPADNSGEPADNSGDPDVMGSCTEHPSGQFYCELQVLSCESDGDCPGLLKCLESWGITCPGAGAGGGVAMGGAGGVGGAPAMAPDSPTDPNDDTGVGGMGAGSECERVLVSKTCAPDDYFPQPGGPGTGGHSGGTDGGSAGGGTTMPPAMNPGTPGSGSAGAGGAGGASGGESGPSDDDGDGEWIDRPRARFGCAVAGDDATDALWSSLGLLGLVALVLRRRAHTMI